MLPAKASKKADVEAYYNNIVTQLDGVHPGLVFNMDEMGVEMFADMKEVKVFVRQSQVPSRGPLHVGVPRTRRRCTLVVCISLDGETLTPTIITKTKTVNSYLYDRGYTQENLRVFTNETSFITTEIFSRWVSEVFLKRVKKKRKSLHKKLGDFDDKAVLIMDGCSCHQIEPFMEVFAQMRIEVRFLVAHTSHLAQPLDLGIFGRCKNIMRSRFQYIIN